MSVKKYLVQVVYDDRTTFKDSDLELAMTLRTACQQVVSFKTSGSLPLVSVIEEERAEQNEGGLHDARL
jgi:hypothetical protein